MTTTFTWPRPWLLQLYDTAIAEGCIRIVLQGEDEASREAEWKSFKASFLRLRRKKDSGYAIQIRPEYHFVQLRFEPELGKVLIMFSALPDGERLPTIEAVDGKRQLQQPIGSQPHETVEAEVEDFDPTEHVAGLIQGLDLSEEGEGEPTEF